MKLGLFVTCIVLSCGSAMLLADANDNALHIKIDPMPAGWTAQEMVGTFMGYDDNADMVQLNWSTNQEDFKRWCEVIKKREDEGSSQTDYKAAELQPAAVGRAGTMQYDTTGKRGDDAMHGRVYFLQVGKVFCWLRCYSTAAAWEKNKVAFDEMVKNVK